MIRHRFVSVALISFAALWTCGAQGAIKIGDQIRMTDAPGHPGGIFAVANLTQPTESLFGTFCVEIGEFVTIPGTYVVDDISEETADGGVYGVRNLSDEAAWLYYQFRNDDLGTAFDQAYTNDASRAANALQKAIWLAMDYTPGSLPGMTLGVSGVINYTTLAATLLSTASTAVADGWTNDPTNAGGWVQIMNLGKLNTTGVRVGNAQDQLILLPPTPVLASVPEPMSLLVWAALGMCLLGARVWGNLIA